MRTRQYLRCCCRICGRVSGLTDTKGREYNSTSTKNHNNFIALNSLSIEIKMGAQSVRHAALTCQLHTQLYFDSKNSFIFFLFTRNKRRSFEKKKKIRTKRCKHTQSQIWIGKRVNLKIVAKEKVLQKNKHSQSGRDEEKKKSLRSRVQKKNQNRKSQYNYSQYI